MIHSKTAGVAVALLLSACFCGCPTPPASIDGGLDAGADGTDAGDTDAGVGVADAGGIDAGLDAAPSDAGDDAGSADSGVVDSGTTDVDAGPAGQACTFNADCRADERCECDEVTGCFCAFGVRGAGQLGIDACVDGNDCETSLCLEGPNNELVCSGPCDDDNDCGGAVPQCADIAFVGQICIRLAG